MIRNYAQGIYDADKSLKYLYEKIQEKETDNNCQHKAFFGYTYYPCSSFFREVCNCEILLQGKAVGGQGKGAF